MIYPTLSELVEKTGNRYKLVIVVAKRARQIAEMDRVAERSRANAPEPTTLEARIRERFADKNAHKVKIKKNVTKALEEIMADEITY